MLCLYKCVSKQSYSKVIWSKGLIRIRHGSKSNKFSGDTTYLHKLCPDPVSLTSVLIFIWMSPPSQIFSFSVLQGDWNVTGESGCQKGIKWASSEQVSLVVLLEMKKFHHEKGLKDKGFCGEGDEWPAPRLTHQAEQTKNRERLKHPLSWPQKRSQLSSSFRNSARASDALWEDQGVTGTVLCVH